MYNRWVLYYRNSNSSGKLTLRARNSDSGTPSVTESTKFVSLASGAHRELGGTLAPQELCAWWWCQRWRPLWSESLPGTPSSNLTTEFLSALTLPFSRTAPGRFPEHYAQSRDHLRQAVFSISTANGFHLNGPTKSRSLKCIISEIELCFGLCGAWIFL
jgi:hypothetical protein